MQGFKFRPLEDGEPGGSGSERAITQTEQIEARIRVLQRSIEDMMSSLDSDDKLSEEEKEELKRKIRGVKTEILDLGFNPDKKT